MVSKAKSGFNEWKIVIGESGIEFEEMQSDAFEIDFWESSEHVSQAIVSGPAQIANHCQYYCWIKAHLVWFKA